MEIGPVLDDAVALHAHHARLRAVRCDVVRADASMPVRAPRWALLRLLLVIVEEGKRSADRADRDVTVLRVDGDAAWVAAPRGRRRALPAYAAAMAQALRRRGRGGRRRGADPHAAGGARERLDREAAGR